MGWLEIGLVGSVIFAVYYFQQIKITLKEKGHHVDLFTGWISDYRKFKDLIPKETDERTKLRYQGTLNGLHLALVGLVVIAFLLIKNQ